MSEKLAERLAKIGSKSPMELFEECLELHGEMIKHVHKRSNDDFDAIVEDIRKFIENNTELLSSYDVSAFKNLLNGRVMQGIETVGHHQEMKAIAVKDDVVSKMKKSKETKVCTECDLPKPLNDFPNTRGEKKGKMCKACRGKKISKGHNTTKEKAEEGPKRYVLKLEKRNEELEKLLEEERAKNLQSEKDIMENEDTGPGLYFLSAILKCRCSGQLYNYIDQIEGDSAEHAVGQFVLSKEVINNEIISISYEKSICDQDVQRSKSE